MSILSISSRPHWCGVGRHPEQHAVQDSPARGHPAVGPVQRGAGVVAARGPVRGAGGHPRRRRLRAAGRRALRDTHR